MFGNVRASLFWVASFFFSFFFSPQLNFQNFQTFLSHFTASLSLGNFWTSEIGGWILDKLPRNSKLVAWYNKQYLHLGRYFLSSHIYQLVSIYYVVLLIGMSSFHCYSYSIYLHLSSYSGGYIRWYTALGLASTTVTIMDQWGLTAWVVI